MRAHTHLGKPVDTVKWTLGGNNREHCSDRVKNLCSSMNVVHDTLCRHPEPLFHRK
jgi:hypothetical protein